MLPDSASGGGDINRMKFADTAIPDMLQKMLSMGATRAAITAKIAGGATMFAAGSDRFNIGERNVIAVKASLQSLNIRIMAHDTGLNYGRTVFFNPENGEVKVKSATKGERIL
jgi:chemotaxis protein CheD